MLDLDDPVALAAALVREDTAGKDEDACTLPIAQRLRRRGFEVHLVPTAVGRTNVVARWNGGGRLVLAGHADTVPHAGQRWRRHPLEGAVVDGRLHGRGASDMKGGLAAMIVAAERAAAEGSPPFTLTVTIGEETGCLGARDVAASGLLPERPVLVLGESTGNALRFGHKGATWLRVEAHGTAAHGSRPELGDSAIARLASLVLELERLTARPPGTHPELGAPTASTGVLHGGEQPNLVPALAVAELDLRTVPGIGIEHVEEALARTVPRRSVETLLELPPVWTDPAGAESGWMLTHAPGGGAVSYFTDASVLARDGAPAYVLGPGDPDQPHTADEHCAVAAIVDAERLYRALLLDADALPAADGH